MCVKACMNRVKNCVFLVRKWSYTTFNIVNIRKMWEKKGKIRRNRSMTKKRSSEIFTLKMEIFPEIGPRKFFLVPPQIRRQVSAHGHIYAILGRRRTEPQCDAPSFSADDFLASFKKKIADIRQDTSHSTPPVFHPTDCKLSTMNDVTSAELRCIILTSPPKSCELDPIPTFLLQEFVDDLLPFLTALCNRSVQDGVLPPSQKRSVLVPVLKRSGLDSTDPLNFRPIANVSFMSKIIEKIAAYQLTIYLETNKLPIWFSKGSLH